MNEFPILKQLPLRKVLDVRSPAEYLRGHIPGALNFPLFTNDERAAVGTTYKQEGKEKAVIQGLQFVGPRMADMVRQALEISPERELTIHCWRGGMRSSSVAWLLKQAGFQTSVIAGGYKSYRHEVQHYLGLPFRYVVLSGPTGSGKTNVLQALKSLGEQVIDLETLASHKGSSFGALGMSEQPAIEQFENLLVEELLQMNQAKPVWIEDESRKIGKVVLQQAFWNHKISAPVIKINVPLILRIHQLVKDYGRFTADELQAGILRISKRLGPQHARHALEALNAGNLDEVAKTCLIYYDKAYSYSFERNKREQVVEIGFDHMDAERIAKEIKKLPAGFR
jgi:tRNA 2-selenouridine synthase